MTEQVLWSGPQETALVSLAGGARIFEAAASAGVSRETVSRWLNHDPDFADELKRRREELWARHMDRLFEMMPTALEGMFCLMGGAEYHGGAEFYDPKVRLGAISLYFRIVGLLPLQGPGLALQVNVAQTMNKE